MANETQITVIGNLTADPELRFTQNGLAVANFTIASTPRVFDRQRNEFVDGDPLFLRSTVWRDMAEVVAERFMKGQRVIAQGRLTQKSFTDKEGNRRTSIEFEVDDIGESLRWAQVGQGGGRSQSQARSPRSEGWYADSRDGGADEEAPF